MEFNIRKNFLRNTQTVKQIYDSFHSGKLIIDNSYQRRKVWMPQDNIRLIETVLLNLIIPEVFFWQAETNADNGETITHIVDGQQRINAIIDFLSGTYSLQKRYLLNDETNDMFGNKFFVDLSPDCKKAIWNYDISIVNIDRDCTIDDIKKMFYRLNLTDYSLNEQEKRNSINSEFGDIALELSKNEFWEKQKVFSASDVRRMKDVEYCATILILVREGIVDQTSSKKINDTYDDLKENYNDSENDIKQIVLAMDMIYELSDKSTKSFTAKKAQLYTVFCLCFKMLEKKIDLNQDIIKRFRMFVETYNKYKNGWELSFEDTTVAKAYENINKYKLASSEGINKINNRVIRLEVLEKFCLKSNNTINDVFKTLVNEFDEKLKTTSITEDDEDSEDDI